MRIPRIRVIGGPNGSGKSTLLPILGSHGVFFGHYQNPDVIEADLRRSGQLEFEEWGILCDDPAFQSFRGAHALNPRTTSLRAVVENNTLKVEGAYPGYFTPLLCDFMRHQWVASRESFTFESVLSGPDKATLLMKARRVGYRLYLYYVCTDDPRLNQERVAARVAQGGHDVPLDKLTARYYSSLRAVPALLAIADRAYFFDNSTTEHVLVAEYEAGKPKMVATDPPLWFTNWVLNPQSE